MAIRNAHEHDFVRCIEISRQAWPDFAERPSIYHLFCKFFRNTCFVSEDAGVIQAFLLGFLSQVDRSMAYIHLVAVDPPAQRHGLARHLYEAFESTVRQMGAKHIGLIVNPDNAGSLAFHHSMGFELDPHVQSVPVDGVLVAKDYNGPGIDMVCFRKEI
jgi:ribosomal protein S18 acetylase RimI-like enzyme